MLVTGRKRGTLKDEDEIELIRLSSILVGKALAEVGRHIKPGVSTLKLDNIAESFIRDHGGRPAFKNYEPSFGESPFPYSLCVSINEEVVHGFPSKDRILKDGDIVSVDCGVELNSYFGDSAYTFSVGEVDPLILNLMNVTKQSLYKGIEKAIVGNRLGEIGNAIQKHAERYGYSVVKEMVGHGVGKMLHEPPEVPNHGSRFSGFRMKEGLVLAIEPMINMGKRFIDTAEDGWTVYTKDGLPSAHYEHCVVIRKNKAEILTTYQYIEN